MWTLFFCIISPIQRCMYAKIKSLPIFFLTGLIESITRLREGRGNPIWVSKICNSRRGLPRCGCWTQGWDSWVPPATWWLITFLLLSKCTKSTTKLDMCLWNTDAPSGDKVKLCQKSLSPTFWPRPTPGACNVSEAWATLKWTYSPSSVTVWPPKF